MKTEFIYYLSSITLMTTAATKKLFFKLDLPLVKNSGDKMEKSVRF